MSLTTPANPRSSEVNPIAQSYIDKVEKYYDENSCESNWFKKQYVGILGHYYNLLIPEWASVVEIGCGGGDLLKTLVPRKLAGVDISKAQLRRAQKSLPNSSFYQASGESLQIDETFDYIILSETINQVADIQQLFHTIRGITKPDSRLVLNFHSNLWKPIFDLATTLGLRASGPPSSWLSHDDVLNLLHLTDWEVILEQPRVLLPVALLGLEKLINRWIAPLLPVLNLTYFIVARPRPLGERAPLSVSVIIPARNEEGNIRQAVKRLPQFGKSVEVIFVEGHSKDNTWQEIQKVVAEKPQGILRAIQQTGRGKGNAVREGFAIAKGDILMILDADLTAPPEDLPKFYEAIASGRAEFANGVRLVYPMEKKAMQFLNLCANKTFGLLFTYLIGQKIKDSLCGTKVLTRAHYEKILTNRSYFGDFDPFGDFDLLFGAAKLNYKIADIPVRYQDRSYGETNIQRWKHGALLIRMLGCAATKLKFV